MTPEKVFISYREYGELLNNMTIYLKQLDTKFNAIIAPPRGALPIAVHLSHNLNIKTILIKNVDILDFLISRDDNVLLVDDIVDTGITMNSLVTNIKRSFKIGKLYTASLYYKERSIFEPNYYCYKTRDWIVFPYESLEEIPNKPGYEHL